MKLKLQEKELRAIGYPEGPVISISIALKITDIQVVEKCSFPNISKFYKN
jgi:hypothetical protein